MEEIIEKLKNEARASWDGSVGEDRATALEKFVRGMLYDYSEALGLSQEEILKSIEGSRTWSAINFYQEARFPKLSNVKLFDSRDALLAATPSRKFRCPRCEGVSTSPYDCNSGKDMELGKVCDWKSYGLFGTLGKGVFVAIKGDFLKYPRIEEIFTPIDFEEA